MRLSIVIPLYNEAESVQELHAEMEQATGNLAGEREFIYVNDGSSDDTQNYLDALAEAHPYVKVIQFSRNRGKSAAYMEGFAAVEGQVVITMDGDLQDDPAEIPNLLACLDEGHDLVIGWKQGRMENEPLKKIPSAVFNSLVSASFGLRIHDSNCGMRAMRASVAESLLLYGDLYRFIPELAHMRGFRVTELPIAHRKRKYSYSKYGAKRFWTGALDLLTVRFLTKYREKPLHFFGTLGMIPTVTGVGLEVYVLVRKLSGSLFQDHVAAIIIGVMLILLGAQLLATGLIGEMLSSQIHHLRHNAPTDRRRSEDKPVAQRTPLP